MSASKCTLFLDKNPDFKGDCSIAYHKSNAGKYYQIFKGKEPFILFVTKQKVKFDDHALESGLLRLIEQDEINNIYFHLFAQDSYVPMNQLITYISSLNILSVFDNFVAKIGELRFYNLYLSNLQYDTVFVDIQSLEVRFLDIMKYEEADVEKEVQVKKEFDEIKIVFKQLTHMVIPYFNTSVPPVIKVELLAFYDDLVKYVDGLKKYTYKMSELRRMIQSADRSMEKYIDSHPDIGFSFKIKGSFSRSTSNVENISEEASPKDRRNTIAIASLAILFIVFVVIGITTTKHRRLSIQEDVFEKRAMKNPIANIVYE